MPTSGLTRPTDTPACSVIAWVPSASCEVAGGESFYISVPKMKTNLYTEVTLGFKNAMGTIPYNLRQRNLLSLVRRHVGVAELSDDTACRTA